MPEHDIIKVGAKVRLPNWTRTHVEVLYVGKRGFVGADETGGEMFWPIDAAWGPFVEPAPPFVEGWYRVYADGLVGNRHDQREAVDADVGHEALMAVLHIDADGTPTIERLP